MTNFATDCSICGRRLDTVPPMSRWEEQFVRELRITGGETVPGPVYKGSKAHAICNMNWEQSQREVEDRREGSFDI